MRKFVEDRGGEDRVLMHVVNSELNILSMKSQWDFKGCCAKDSVSLKFTGGMGT